MVPPLHALEFHLGSSANLRLGAVVVEVVALLASLIQGDAG